MVGSPSDDTDRQPDADMADAVNALARVGSAVQTTTDARSIPIIQLALGPQEFAGDATYYPKVGRTTASGAPYDPNGRTAAMTKEKAKFGTTVTIRMRDDPSRSVTAIVNDRGPFSGDRMARPSGPCSPIPKASSILRPPVQGAHGRLETRQGSGHCHGSRRLRRVGCGDSGSVPVSG